MERAGWSQGPCAEAQRRWGICMSRGTGEAAGSLEGLWDSGTRRAGVERRRSRGEEGAVQQLSREFGSLVTRLCGHEGFRPEQITLLTPRTRPNSSLAGLERLAGWQMSDDPHDRQGRLLHCTVGKFKGLESDIVILLDVEPGHPRSVRAVRYCGASRAKHRLHVFVKGGWEG